MKHRLIEVPGARLPRWVDGFEQRHGTPEVAVDARSVCLTAPDGALARLDVPFGPAALPPGDPVTALAARTRLAGDSLLLLVRRGGVAVGVARDGVIIAHRAQTKYVQGRTAAGGWSQQRFARRRAGQTAALTDAATEAAVDILLGHGEHAQVLVTGGDRALLDQVLADPRLAAVAALPRSPMLDVPDPRRAVLDEALRRAGSVRIHLDEPDPS